MLQPNSPDYPHTLAQWFYIVLAWFLGSGMAVSVLTLWQKRKHGPAEVRKLDAETRSILVRDDIALGESVSRLIREVAQATIDTENRRQEWLLQDEQWREKVVFWRNKAEELDGQVIDLKYDLEQLETRYNKKDHELNGALALLLKHEISYAELDQPREK